MSAVSGVGAAMLESFTSGPNAPRVISWGTKFYWAVRRELWEYRSIYLAPLGFAGVVLLGFPFALFRLPRQLRSAMAMDVTHRRAQLVSHYEITAALILGAAFIVSIYYAIDALYGERRDRSILFWKSLPVSDLTTVLAKASIPLLVLPFLSFAITLVTELIMLLLSSVVALASGLSVGVLWRGLAPFQSIFGLLYHLVTVHMLWYAPLYAWLLLISAWARRAPFLWAALPPLAIGVFEKMAFHSNHFTKFLMNRVGGMQGMPTEPGVFMPGAFLLTPGLWIGLAFAALFLWSAARLRRYREPS
jgi:ABC-2 type transport system permease protein